MASTGASPVGKDPAGKDCASDDAIPTSFKDKLLGSKLNAKTIRNEFVLDEDIQARIKITYIDNDRLKPRINFEDKLEEELCHSWRFSLVVKVYGRTVGYHYLTNKLGTLWQPLGEWEVLDVGNGFFVVKFHEEDDMIAAFTGGPYSFGSSHLSIQRWTPDFFPSTARITKIATWIKLSELPLHHYNDNSLYAIASCIGVPLKLDHQTALVSRGKYALVCHLSGSCPIRPQVVPPLVGSVQSGRDDEPSPLAMPNLPKEPLFGEWMKPRRKGHRRANPIGRDKPATGTTKSRPSQSSTSAPTAARAPTLTNSFNALYEHDSGDDAVNPTYPTLSRSAPAANESFPQRSRDETTPTEPLKEKKTTPAVNIVPPSSTMPPPTGGATVNTITTVPPSETLPSLTDVDVVNTDIYMPGASKRLTGERPEAAPNVGGGGFHSPVKPPAKRRVMSNEKNAISENPKEGGTSNFVRSSNPRKL
ncbi:hypothetical protein LINGRAHAP2_LOCUS9562 [Linum grandiflorum]